MGDTKKIPEHLRDVADALPPLATVPEATAVMRLCSSKVRQLVARGELRAVRSSPTGSARLLIPRSEILRYLGAHEVQA